MLPGIPLSWPLGFCTNTQVLNPLSTLCSLMFDPPLATVDHLRWSSSWTAVPLWKWNQQNMPLIRKDHPEMCSTFWMGRIWYLGNRRRRLVEREQSNWSREDSRVKRYLAAENARLWLIRLISRVGCCWKRDRGALAVGTQDNDFHAMELVVDSIRFHTIMSCILDGAALTRWLWPMAFFSRIGYTDFLRGWRTRRLGQWLGCDWWARSGVFSSKVVQSPHAQCWRYTHEPLLKLHQRMNVWRILAIATELTRQRLSHDTCAFWPHIQLRWAVCGAQFQHSFLFKELGETVRFGQVYAWRTVLLCWLFFRCLLGWMWFVEFWFPLSLFRVARPFLHNPQALPLEHHHRLTGGSGVDKRAPGLPYLQGSTDGGFGQRVNVPIGVRRYLVPKVVLSKATRSVFELTIVWDIGGVYNYSFECSMCGHAITIDAWLFIQFYRSCCCYYVIFITGSFSHRMLPTFTTPKSATPDTNGH